MPFFDRNDNPIQPGQVGQGVPWGVGDGDASDDTPSFGETLRANFRLNNVIDSALESHRTGTLTTPVDTNFNPWDEIKGTPYEDDWKRFVDVRNRTDFELLKQDIDAENIARNTLGRSGTVANLSTGLLAGIADPLMLVPGVEAVRGAKVGYDALKTALVTGASVAAITGTQEAILHATQQTRGLDESAYNILGASVVGSILGGVIAKAMTRAEISSITRTFAADLASGHAANPDADAVEQVIKSVRDSKSFTTAKGSTYQVHEDGTTTRNKAPRPEHPGEEGPQPRSHQTFYVDAEGADKLSLFQTEGAGKMAVQMRGPQAAVKFLEGENADKFAKTSLTDIKKEPEVGLIPVETWDNGTKVHFGNPITEVKGADVPTPATTGTAKSGGSAATPVPHIDELQIDGKVAKAAARMAPFSPIMRALQWASPKARSLMFRLAETPSI
jgi:hypothetical protein